MIVGLLGLSVTWHVIYFFKLIGILQVNMDKGKILSVSMDKLVKKAYPKQYIAYPIISKDNGLYIIRY